MPAPETYQQYIPPHLVNRDMAGHYGVARSLKNMLDPFAALSLLLSE